MWAASARLSFVVDLASRRRPQERLVLQLYASPPVRPQSQDDEQHNRDVRRQQHSGCSIVPHTQRPRHPVQHSVDACPIDGPVRNEEGGGTVEDHRGRRALRRTRANSFKTCFLANTAIPTPRVFLPRPIPRYFQLIRVILRAPDYRGGLRYDWERVRLDRERAAIDVRLVPPRRKLRVTFIRCNLADSGSNIRMGFHRWVDRSRSLGSWFGPRQE